MNLYAEKVGLIEFGDRVDITDPCYDRDVWCRLNDIEIVPGEYCCIIWRPENPKDEWDVGRIFAITICSMASDKQFDMDDAEQIGEIGVDAGLAGFLDPKANYSKEEWAELAQEFGGENVFLEDDRFFCSSGYGDGCYPVFASRNESGVIDALEIRFV